ncbi:MAG: LysR family transcriptional regulator [Peptococcaceae bacterium]
MQLEHLEKIVKIDEHKSFSKAAKDLFISQPSLSVAVKTLEKELGYRIFKRGSNGVEPTRKGQEILVLAKNILELQGQAKMIMNGRQKLVRSLQIALPPALAGTITPRLILKFRRLYPDVQLHIFDKPPYEIAEMMVKGLCSVGIISSELSQENEILEMLNKKNITYEVFSGSIYSRLFVNSRNPLACKDSVNIKELHDFTIISYKDNYLKTFGRQAKVITVNDFELIKKLLKENFGVAVLPEIIAINDLFIEKGIIKVIPIDDMRALGIIYLLYPNKEFLSRIESELIDILRELTIELMSEEA